MLYPMHLHLVDNLSITAVICLIGKPAPAVLKEVVSRC